MAIAKTNKITVVTRRHVADAMQIAGIGYHGNQTEPNFLGRIFNLTALPSTDHRFPDAYGDIYQHVVNNHDWDDGWIYTDSRINLLHCEDQVYLSFLSETLHPIIRADEQQRNTLVALYNKHLDADGFEIVQKDAIAGKPVFEGRPKLIGQGQLAAKKAEIKKFLNTSYVGTKINTMTEAIHTDTDLALGTAKDLLETVCKSILKQKGQVADKNWNLSQLLKATTRVLNFTPKNAENPDKAEESIRMILAGVGTIVNGVGELRNAYGTGHGKNADFHGLEPKYAKLFVGVVSEIAILYLTTNGESAELVETE